MLSADAENGLANPAAVSEGVVRIRSAHDVARTVERLVGLFARHGLRVFAHLDFAADAAAVGLALRPEQLVIFGNPKSGTPLLEASPSVGLDLPLKALVFEDADGATWLAYNDPGYILGRHAVPLQLANNIEGATALMVQAASP
jgi:uncharacterized protein (DUF302 family)